MSRSRTGAVTRSDGMVLVLVALFAVVVLRNAWMHDDAYITFRTVDNVIGGYGLRWNPAERVQTYTHPLWLFAVSACYAVTHEVFFTVTFLSVALSVATVLLLFGVARSRAAGGVGVVVLTCSKAFVDYSTSGLENPLTHFLFASFLLAYFRREPTLSLLYLLASLAALGAVNRLDTVLLYVPALALVLFQVDRTRGLAVVAAGFLPLALWEAFSLVYYGFPFPNTAYAKLFGAGVGAMELVRHGLYYLQNSARLDPLTLLTIGIAVAAAVSSSDRRNHGVAAGIAAYLAYVVYIGGDFVTGRFLGAPLLGAVVLLTRCPSLSRPALAGAVGAVAIAVGLSSANPPLLSTAAAGSEGKALMDAHGIADERDYYYPYSGLLRALQGVPLSSHPWAVAGLEARRLELPLAVRGDIGYFGFHAGPGVHVIDVWGLADPLIARLPARTDIPWRVGHFTRAIPEGYPETLRSGRNQITDRTISVLYDRLTLITRGPLFDANRLAAIWKMNLGRWGVDGG